MKICIALPAPISISESFIAAHLERLPAEIVVLELNNLAVRGFHGEFQPLLSETLLAKSRRELGRRLLGQTEERQRQHAYAGFFRRQGVVAVLAEYGFTGVQVAQACCDAGVPLVVHFHGHDVSMRTVLERYGRDYMEMFRRTAGVVAVSKAMQERLLGLGALKECLHYNPCGVDCEQFGGAHPETSLPVFMAVGRFVEKKAPYLTLMAFATVHREFPAARLRMIGAGPLLGPCMDLAKALGVAEAVAFLGSQPHEVVREEMRRARAFVQHSVEAIDGDSEGTPVAVLEAGASGLPVVATRHAGIPDVVIEGKTGLLVDERDVATMASHMHRLVVDPGYAGALGAAARVHIATNHTMQRSLGRLWEILQSAIAGRPAVVGTALVPPTRGA